jgi:ABC-type nitrate/sulfonate/bicarbonate transport system substrate-binding protein
MMTRAKATFRSEASSPVRRGCLKAALLLALFAAGTGAAPAADLIRVGKASSTTFAFAPIEIGTEKGIWTKYGLAVESIGFGGDARLQQAMVADAIEFSLGSGPGMGFIAKGVPAMTVAAMANEPLAMGLTVGKNSPIKKFEDLKGATVSVSTSGSLTLWLVREFSRQMGWGATGIKTVPLGVNPAQVAALKAGNVQGIVSSSSIGYALEKDGEGRVLVEFGEHVKDFHTHVIFATNTVIASRPDVVRRAAVLVDQEPFVFHTSIAENLRYARPVISERHQFRVALCGHKAFDRMAESFIIK